MVERIEPQAGQESVWDYPRPPRVEKSSERIRVVVNGQTIIDSTDTYRVLETSHPPTYYIPRKDVQMQALTPTQRNTYCEFKGQASYYTVEVDGQKVVNGAWTYTNPNHGYEAIKDHIAVYPSRMEACYVDDEQVTPQEGDFYGGWITSKVVGPFKGGAGTRGW